MFLNLTKKFIEELHDTNIQQLLHRVVVALWCVTFCRSCLGNGASSVCLHCLDQFDEM